MHFLISNWIIIYIFQMKSEFNFQYFFNQMNIFISIILNLSHFASIDAFATLLNQSIPEMDFDQY